MFANYFPLELHKDLSTILSILPKYKYTEDRISYVLSSGMIAFPYRIYMIDVEDEIYKSLTPIQQQLICCIYTRSHNGFVREKYLRRLLEMDFSPWSIPYIVKLCDEYVIELLELVYEQLKNRDNRDIHSFCLQNKAMIHRGYTRMTSYWNEFYRDREHNFKNYIGRKLFRECFGYTRSFEK